MWRLRDAPNKPRFLYFSDHDVSGFHIFQILKYGCAKAAWASEYLICPSLEFMGASKDDVKQHYKKYWRTTFKTSLRDDNPNMTTEELNKSHAAKVNAQQKTLEKSMKSRVKNHHRTLAQTIKKTLGGHKKVAESEARLLEEIDQTLNENLSVSKVSLLIMMIP